MVEFPDERINMGMFTAFAGSDGLVSGTFSSPIGVGDFVRVRRARDNFYRVVAVINKGQRAEVVESTPPSQGARVLVAY